MLECQWGTLVQEIRDWFCNKKCHEIAYMPKYCRIDTSRINREIRHLIPCKFSCINRSSAKYSHQNTRRIPFPSICTNWSSRTSLEIRYFIPRAANLPLGLYIRLVVQLVELLQPFGFYAKTLVCFDILPYTDLTIFRNQLVGNH